MSIENLKTFGMFFFYLPSFPIVLLSPKRRTHRASVLSPFGGVAFHPSPQLAGVVKPQILIYFLNPSFNRSLRRGRRRHRRDQAGTELHTYTYSAYVSRPPFWPFAAPRKNAAFYFTASELYMMHDVSISSILILIPSLERNGRKTLTTVQGLPKKFDQKKILKVIKKKFGTCVFLWLF